MKKFIAFLLTFVCLMTTSVPVFAANEVDVFFDGNGGTFNYHMDIVRTGDYFGDFAEVGTKISDKQNAVLTDPVFWDSSREFLGWMPYELQMAEPPAPVEMIPLATEPITSQEALDYVIPNCTIQFVAQWAGDDSEYYSEVTIHGFGGDVAYFEFVDGPNRPGVDSTAEEKWNYLKESTDSIKVQVSNDYEIIGDPVKENATFEGWLEFSVETTADGTKKYKLISDSLITTDEMMGKTVPSYDVVFVAKWSDVEMKEYYDYFDIVVEEVKKEQHVEINSGLQEVPNGVADKYTTTTDIENALTEKALNANENFVVDKVKSVLMDVALQFKNASGEWETVTYDNFPTEGVETVLPYPEGTNKEDFDFIIAHMISAGDKAGEIEILNGVFEEDGIRVKFTSMSPVMIMYQAKNTTDTPTDTTTNVESPKTGDTSNIWLMFTLLLVSGGALVVLGIKRGLQS